MQIANLHQQIFSVKYNLIYNSVGYGCIDMENIFADNENDILTYVVNDF